MSQALLIRDGHKEEHHQRYLEKGTGLSFIKLNQQADETI